MAISIEIGSTTEATFVRFSFFRFPAEFLPRLEARLWGPSTTEHLREQHELLRHLERVGESDEELVRVLLELGLPPEICEMAIQPPSARQVAATFSLVSALCELSSGLPPVDRETFHAASPAAVIEIRMESPLAVLVEIPAFVSVPAAVASFVLAVEQVALAPVRIRAKREQLRLAAAQAIHDQAALEAELDEKIVPLIGSSLAMDRVDLYDGWLRVGYDDSEKGWLGVGYDTSEKPAALPIGNWRVDPLHSRIDLRVTGDGHTFRAQFSKIQGKIEVPSDDDPIGFCTVDVACVDTPDRESDSFLHSVGLLNADRYPHIQFVTTKFEATGQGEVFVTGQLEIRGVTRLVTVATKVEASKRRADAQFIVSGGFQIKCSDFVNTLPGRGSGVPSSDTATITLVLTLVGAKT